MRSLFEAETLLKQGYDVAGTLSLHLQHDGLRSIGAILIAFCSVTLKLRCWMQKPLTYVLSAPGSEHFILLWSLK